MELVMLLAMLGYFGTQAAQEIWGKGKRARQTGKFGREIELKKLAAGEKELKEKRRWEKEDVARMAVEQRKGREYQSLEASRTRGATTQAQILQAMFTGKESARDREMQMLLSLMGGRGPAPMPGRPASPASVASILRG